MMSNHIKGGNKERMGWVNIKRKGLKVEFSNQERGRNLRHLKGRGDARSLYNVRSRNRKSRWISQFQVRLKIIIFWRGSGRRSRRCNMIKMRYQCVLTHACIIDYGMSINIQLFPTMALFCKLTTLSQRTSCPKLSNLGSIFDLTASDLLQYLHFPMGITSWCPMSSAGLWLTKRFEDVDPTPTPTPTRICELDVPPPHPL